MPPGTSICGAGSHARALPHLQAPVRTGAWVFYGGHVSQLWPGARRHGACVATDGMGWEISGRGHAGEQLSVPPGFALVIPLLPPAVAIP